MYLVKFAIFEGLALSSFEHATHHNEGEAMKAVAHLPGLDIEIVNHPSSDGLAEHISINLKAVPSFEAFARFYETMNPFVFWPRRHGLFGFLGSRPCVPPWFSKVPLRCRSVGPRSRAASTKCYSSVILARGSARYLGVQSISCVRQHS